MVSCGIVVWSNFNLLWIIVVWSNFNLLWIILVWSNFNLLWIIVVWSNFNLLWIILVWSNFNLLWIIVVWSNFNLLWIIVVWSNFNLLLVIFPTQSCLVLNSFYACFLYSLYYVSDCFIFFHHITYTCYSVDYYKFSLWYNSSLWHYFVLLLKEIQFFSWSFLFFDMSRSSRVQSPSLSLKTSIQLFFLIFFSFLLSRFCCFYCWSLNWHCSYRPL